MTLCGFVLSQFFWVGVPTSEVVLKPQCLTELGLRRGALHVDLVSEHEDGHASELVVGEELVQLSFCLREAITIIAVNQIHNGIDGREILAPQLARHIVPAEVVHAELELAHRELLVVRVLGWLELRNLLFLEHVQKSGLSRIVKTQEKDLGLLVPQA